MDTLEDKKARLLRLRQETAILEREIEKITDTLFEKRRETFFNEVLHTSPVFTLEGWDKVNKFFFSTPVPSLITTEYLKSSFCDYMAIARHDEITFTY